MKGYVTRGGGFGGVMDYLTKEKKPGDAPEDWKPSGPRPGHTLIQGNMAGTTSRTTTKEFGISRALRPECKNPVWHTPLSLPAGEYLTEEQWHEAGRLLMSKVGMDPDLHQWTMVKHTDTPYEHAHLVASRIGLDGSIWHGKWEARTVHHATQEIEMEMGLVQTPGPGPKLPNETGPHVNVSKKERLIWEQKGVEIPPKVAIACSLEDAIANSRGDLQVLKAEMAADKIEVHINQAKTGRISGLAFTMTVAGEKCRYKASQIHKAYSWKQLEPRLNERKETHERERRQWGEDNHISEGEGYGQAALRPGDGGDVSSGDLKLARELSNLARGFSDGNYGTDRAPGGNPGAPGRDHPNPEGSYQGADGGNSSDGNAGDGADQRQVTQRHDANGSQAESIQPTQQALDPIGEQGGRSDEEPRRLKEGDRSPAPRPGQQAHTDRPVNGPGVRRNSDSVLHSTMKPAWNVRFKKASAARKRAKHPRPMLVGREQIQDARAVDPQNFIGTFNGYEVKTVGKQRSIKYHGDEVYRGTFKNGHWVYCDRHENGVGDNITLMREITGKGFVDAVWDIHGAPSFRTQSAQDYSYRRPTMPPCNDKAQEQGRRYLAGRGISGKTIKKAEKAGFTAYTLDGVLTLGRDQAGKVRSITRRAWDKKAEVQKRDLRYSNKVDFPPILPGDPGRVLVVEGGIDALGAHDICHRQGREAPTIIVSSSASAMGFLEPPHVQKILKSATQVTVAFENDSVPATKAKTDAAHKKQMARIMEIVPAFTVVQPYHPPKGCKDIADANFAMANAEIAMAKGWDVNNLEVEGSQEWIEAVAHSMDYKILNADSTIEMDEAENSLR